jgi:hypothetical protein
MSLETAQGGSVGCSNLIDRGKMTTSGTAMTACSSQRSAEFCLKRKSPKLRDIRSLTVRILAVYTSYSGAALGSIPSTTVTLQARDERFKFIKMETTTYVNKGEKND